MSTSWDRLFVVFPQCLFLMLTSAATVSAQSAAGPQNSPSPGTLPEPASQEQFLPYWTTETSWHSELHLRNNLSHQNLVVTPVLRTLDGTEYTLVPVTLKPNEVQAIDLDAAIGTGAPQLIATYGSVVLRYKSLSMGNLYAAMMLRNIGHSIAFHVDGTGLISNYEAAGREGIWWLPNDTTTDYLLFANYGDSQMALDLSLFDASGKQFQQKLSLAPRQTERISVRDLVLQGGLTGSYGGIRVYAAAHAGSLDTLHLLFDQKAGFSALLKMFDHDPNANLPQRDFPHTGIWTLRAPMLALTQPDPALSFPEGTTLQPQLFIRNTTGKPLMVALRFNWRADSTTGKAQGPSLKLHPYETRRIDVAALQDDKTLPQDAHWASVIITTDGQPDEIMAVAASYDAALQHGAQTPFSDQLSFAWEGGTWEYDAQHNSLITVGNGGTKPTQAALMLFYNQGTQRYNLEQTLQPDEQMWIDVGKLIREHVTDKDGKVLPADLSSGSYQFRDLTDSLVGSLFEGKVIYEKTYGHVTYGCAACCYYTTPWLNLNPLGVPMLGSAPNEVESDDCNGNTFDVSPPFYGSWRTANTAIATVDTRGNHSGVSVGSTTSATQGSLMMEHGAHCYLTQTSPGGGDNVQVPTSLQFLSVTVLPDGTSGAFGCPANASGIRVDIKYQVMDQQSPPQPIRSANMIPHESGKLFSGAPYDNNIGPVSGYPTSSGYAAADGTFHDVPLGACLIGGTFTSLTATQNVTILIGTNSYPVRSQTWTVTGSSIGHGTIKNSISSPGSGSDVSATR